MLENLVFIGEFGLVVYFVLKAIKIDNQQQADAAEEQHKRD